MSLPNWISVSQNQGSSGTSIITITAATYSELNQRTGALTVATVNAGLSKTVNLVQQAREVVNVDVSPNSLTIPQTGGTYVFNVISNGEWELGNIPEWMSVSQTSGNGNASVFVTTNENFGVEVLSYNLQVHSIDNIAYISITQEAIIPVLDVSPVAKTLSYSGGTYYLNIYSNFVWSVSHKEDFIYMSETSGSGDTIVTVQVSGTNYSDTYQVVDRIKITDTINEVETTCILEPFTGSTSEQPLHLIILSGGTVNCMSNTEYSKNGFVWYEFDNSGEIEVETGDVVFLRNATESKRAVTQLLSGTTATYNVKGNIHSVIVGKSDSYTLESLLYPANRCFEGTNVVDASELILPATKIYNGAYKRMFANCSELEKAPYFPATDIGTSAYTSVFENCTKLNDCIKFEANHCVGILPTSDNFIGYSIFDSAFKNCSSLETMPVIPYMGSMKLSKSALKSTFQNCTNLTNGALDTRSSDVGADGFAYSCFEGCDKIKEVYFITNSGTTYSKNMYKDCSELNYIYMDSRQGGNLTAANMTDGVSSTGTFIKSSKYSWTIGTSGIPYNWTVINAPELLMFSGDVKAIYYTSTSDWEVTRKPRWVNISRTSGMCGSYGILLTVNIQNTLTEQDSYILEITNSNGEVTTYDLYNSTLLSNDYAYMRYLTNNSSAITISDATLRQSAVYNNYISDGYGLLVTKMKDYPSQSFKGNTRITYLDTGTVNNIGMSCFSACTSLTQIETGSRLKMINSNAFDSCTALTALTLTEGLTTIGVCAFFNCGTFNEPLYLPSTVTNTGNRWFEGCSFPEIKINCPIKGYSTHTQQSTTSDEQWVFYQSQLGNDITANTITLMSGYTETNAYNLYISGCDRINIKSGVTSTVVSHLFERLVIRYRNGQEISRTYYNLYGNTGNVYLDSGMDTSTYSGYLPKSGWTIQNE